MGADGASGSGGKERVLAKRVLKRLKEEVGHTERAEDAIGWLAREGLLLNNLGQ